MRLCVLHNLYFYNTMMSEIRQAIEEGRYKEYKKQKLEGFLENDKKYQKQLDGTPVFVYSSNNVRKRKRKSRRNVQWE